MEEGEDLTITELEASWVSSISSLGFPVGALLSSFFIDIMGKKWSTIFGQAASYCIGYSLITFAVNVECMYAGRFFCGICQVIVLKFLRQYWCINTLQNLIEIRKMLIIALNLI